MEICNENRCTGCGACSNVCPANTIKMKENDLGELHPFIGGDCIECGLCQMICPANTIPEKRHPQKVYAAWRQEKNGERRFSASGGIASVFNEKIFEDGGAVFGIVYEKLSPVYKAAESAEDLERFKGSKYVQANTASVYQEVRSRLEQDKEVLFIGTGCQVAGLKNYLGKKQYPKLFTVDLLCHGVSPAAYLEEHTKQLMRKYKIAEVDNITFRTNIHKRNFCLCLWKGNVLKYHKTAYEDNYFHAFLTGLSLRESCYTCQYKGTGRVADLTIGDFIGLGKEIPFEPRQRQVSIILVNTEKGKELLERCGENVNLIERTLDEALKEGTSLREPFPRHPRRDYFAEFYKKKGFSKAAMKIQRRGLIVAKLQRYLRIVQRTLHV